MVANGSQARNDGIDDDLVRPLAVDHEPSLEHQAGEPQISDRDTPHARMYRLHRVGAIPVS